ncbi:hypothetical protein ABH940_003222 [Streptacidiphilus sp. BW17]|uniref:SAM-dependent methyltransferase n=1 Tax=unclassified Streptacidiphilus TaxID=2643834 RepID=UPI0035145E84
MPLTESLWRSTRSFFPLFQRQLELANARTVCVVGASDGKFVLPLARSGYRVTAIDRDQPALEGDLPNPGLRQRLAAEELTDRVDIITGDVLDLVDSQAHDGIWTSCSWHYSINHRRPLKDFTNALQSLCSAGGLLGAEYMMPVEPRHEQIEHYLDEEEIRAYFPGWEAIWETYTPAFDEAPHPGQPSWHRHRMGLFIGRRQNESRPRPTAY